ncbi:hypothetical protein D3C72_1683420 [compost metagenome]
MHDAVGIADREGLGAAAAVDHGHGFDLFGNHLHHGHRVAAGRPGTDVGRALDDQIIEALDLIAVRHLISPTVDGQANRLPLPGHAANGHADTRVGGDVAQLFTVAGGDEVEVQPVVQIAERAGLRPPVGAIGRQGHQPLAVQQLQDRGHRRAVDGDDAGCWFCTHDLNSFAVNCDGPARFTLTQIKAAGARAREMAA